MTNFKYFVSDERMFVKGFTDIKICGYIIRKFNKKYGRTITEKREYGVKLA